MGWNQIILTDSGGFQAFALSRLARVSEQGIVFQSHRDGSRHQFTPESVVQMQEVLGVDMATCLDVCTGFPASRKQVRAAVEQTNRWAQRSIAAWSDARMLLYGMVQGSVYEDERRRSAEFLRSLPFGGFAIGGNMYTFGQPLEVLRREKPAMWRVVSFTSSLLPEEKPRHLLGVGEPHDLIDGVRSGIDTFDCVMASRIARHGAAWRRVAAEGWQYERINVRTARWRNVQGPIDTSCTCPTCAANIQCAYLHHLFKVGDSAAGSYLTLHNEWFLRQLAGQIRSSVLDGTFEDKFGYTT